nr:MAG TPA: hypothetical protein [Caudoviricetes sp.]
MDRDCNNCIHHTTGSCSKFNCDFVTVSDVRNKAIDDFANLFKSKTTMENNLVEEIAEQLKVGDNS